VAVALANKMARIAWALLASGGTYRAPARGPVKADECQELPIYRLRNMGAWN